jgi:hypothetical protein
LTCGTESQEHGQETVVDEETIGAYGDHASGLRTKSLGASDKGGRRRRKRKRERHLTSFKDAEVFTFILKGWVEEAIELGASDKLIDIVSVLWTNYLQKLQLAFMRDDAIPKSPSFRFFKNFC